MGTVLSITDAIGGTVTADYDLNGRNTKTTDANGGSTETIYDLTGQNLAQVDAAGHITAMEYDALGNAYEHTYDENGNVIKTVMPDGDIVT